MAKLPKGEGSGRPRDIHTVELLPPFPGPRRTWVRSHPAHRHEISVSIRLQTASEGLIERVYQTMDTRPSAGYAASWTIKAMSGKTTVTEQEWLNCTDPEPMLEFWRGKVSNRKLRLFAVACCLRVLHLLLAAKAYESGEAIEVAESSADGAAASHRLA